MVELKLLGPLLLIVRGERVALGPQTRVLLLVLVLAEGRHLSSAPASWM